MTIARTEKGHFMKGVSGNPSGRPKQDPEVKEIFKAALPHAAERLVQLIDSRKELVAIKAIEIIFDRTQGKAPQAVSMDLTGGLDIRAQIRAVLLERANCLSNDDKDEKTQLNDGHEGK